MTISMNQIMMVIGGATSLTTGIFWGAFMLGKLYSRMEDVEKSVGLLGTRMDKAGDRMSDLADEIQKIPNTYLTRGEAILWRGSREGDPKN